MSGGGQEEKQTLSGVSAEGDPLLLLSWVGTTGPDSPSAVAALAMAGSLKLSPSVSNLPTAQGHQPQTWQARDEVRLRRVSLGAFPLGTGNSSEGAQAALGPPQYPLS